MQIFEYSAVIGFDCPVMLTMAALFISQIWSKQKSDHEATVFRVAQGASLTQVADELALIGLTDSPVLFGLYARISGSDRGLRAGIYKVPSRQNARELIALFSSGKVQQHAIRLPEGMNLRVVMALLAEQGVLKQRSMGWQHLQDELDLDLPFAEGAFFPDTYFVPAGATDLSVLCGPTMHCLCNYKGRGVFERTTWP